MRHRSSRPVKAPFSAFNQLERHASPAALIEINVGQCWQNRFVSRAVSTLQQAQGRETKLRPGYVTLSSATIAILRPY
jgi:hypothetical protein